MKTAIAAVSFGIFVLVGLAPSYAQTAAETARAWGLIGKWSDNCSNGRIIAIEVEPDGRLVMDNGSRNIMNVESATITNDNNLIVVAWSPLDRAKRTMVIARGNNRVRTLMNRTENNEYSIRNGVSVQTGQPTQWLGMCN